jgi:membrane-associated phospholipid phosphatase
MTQLDPAPAAGATRHGSPAYQLRARACLLLLAALASAGVLTLADAGREHDGPSRVDPIIAADVLKVRAPGLTDLARVFTFLGSEVVVGGLAIVVFGALLMLRRSRDAGVFAIGIGGSAFLTVAVKLLVARPRPGSVDRLGALDTTYSFPSGHTLNSTVFVALVVWLLWPGLRHAGHVALVAGGAVVALGVGASRVYLGYHWLTDVLASVLLALAWLSIVWLLCQSVRRTVPVMTE